MPQRNREKGVCVLDGRCPELRARRRIARGSEIRRIGMVWSGEGGGFEKERPSVRDVSPSPRKDRHVLGSNDQVPKRFITISQDPLRVMYDEEAGRIPPASSPRSSASDGALCKISLRNLCHDGPIGDVDLGGRRGSRSPPPLRRGRTATTIRPCSKAGGTRTGTGNVRPAPRWIERRVGETWWEEAAFSLRRCHLRVGWAKKWIAQFSRRRSGRTEGVWWCRMQERKH